MARWRIRWFFAVNYGTTELTTALQREHGLYEVDYSSTEWTTALCSGLRPFTVDDCFSENNITILRVLQLFGGNFGSSEWPSTLSEWFTVL